MSEIEKLLIEMLRIPSVSGQEKAMGDFLVSQLGDFQLEKQVVAKDRFNIIAKKGQPQTYIVVHIDTVPGVVPIKVAKDRIFGRGAIDNKGNIAGALLVARQLENIGLIFTVGEEVDFCGAKKIKVPDGQFVVMEPTKLQMMRGQRGVIGFDVVASGKQIHSSLSFKKEDSAVYLLTDLVQELYQKNWTALNVIITTGGEADNVVSAQAEGKVLARPKDSQEYQAILNWVKKIKRKNIELKELYAIPPCESSLTKKGKIAPFFSEMAFFKDSVLFGVGNIAQAHTVDEYVERKALSQLEGKLLQLITSLEK